MGGSGGWDDENRDSGDRYVINVSGLPFFIKEKERNYENEAPLACCGRRGFEFESQDLSQANEYGPEIDRPDRPIVQKPGEVRARVTFF